MLLGVDCLRGGLAEGNRISHVKHFLAPLYVFFTLFWCWGGVAPKGSEALPAYALFPPPGSPKGLVHNLLMQFITPGSSKIEVFET